MEASQLWQVERVADQADLVPVGRDTASSSMAKICNNMNTCVDSVGKSLAITLTKLQLYQYNYIFLGAVAEAQVVKRWHSFQGTVFLVPVVEGDGDGGL